MKISPLEMVTLFRRDVNDQLIHLTRATYELTALEFLQKIIDERRLLGGTGYIKSEERCVCFSEAPLTEVAMLLKTYEATSRLTRRRLRYETYGVVVPKNWLYEVDGRPVIYQPECDYDHLSPAVRYRHVRFEPDREIDFTWEREWRIRTKALALDPNNTVIIAPTVEDIEALQDDEFRQIQGAVGAVREDA